MFVLNDSINMNDFLVSIPSTLIIASILTTNNNCDIVGDKKAGRRTLSILVGLKWGKAILYLLGFAGHFFIFYLWYLTILPKAVLIAAGVSFLLSVFIFFKMNKTGFSHSTKGQSMQSISMVLLVFTLTFSLGFAISIII